jgi:hypothetical protein
VAVEGVDAISGLKVSLEIRISQMTFHSEKEPSGECQPGTNQRQTTEY